MQDEVITHKVMTHGENTYAFIATLNIFPTVGMHYEITRDGGAVYGLSELPSDIIAAYGTFVGCMQEWVKGGELDESLQQNDQSI